MEEFLFYRSTGSYICHLITVNMLRIRTSINDNNNKQKVLKNVDKSYTFSLM